MIQQERDAALRALSYALVVTWLSKWDFFAAGAQIYRLRPLHDPFFPSALQTFELLAIAFVLPPLACVAALLSSSRRAAELALAVMAVGSFVLLGHQGAYNDATFVCSLWVSLAGLWLARAKDHPGAPLAGRAAFIAQAVIALQFLGGAAGKLTPGYFDGSALHGIYFAERDHFTFALLRSLLDAEQLTAFARYYSWAVIALELALASLPLWPARPALWAAIAGLSGLVVLNNVRLISVVGSLIALAAAALWLQTAHAKRVELCLPPLALHPVR